MTLDRDEIHVWEFNLDEEAARTWPWHLDAYESARAQRFRFERDRRRFVARRSILRALLGSYLDQVSETIRYRTNHFGKPEIDRGIHFSVSHSDGLGVFAFSRVPIGVDVERVRTISDATQVAAAFFSALEVEQLAALSGMERDVAFLECWTGKEAFVKALGKGLSYPLASFDVSSSPGVPPSLVRHSEPAPWILMSLPTQGAVGSLVAPQPELRVVRCGRGHGR